MRIRQGEYKSDDTLQREHEQLETKWNMQGATCSLMWPFGAKAETLDDEAGGEGIVERLKLW